MAAAQCISRLGAWEGYEVESDQEVRRRGVIWCVIRLKPIAPVLRCCSGCVEWVEPVHAARVKVVVASVMQPLAEYLGFEGQRRRPRRAQG